MAHLAACAPSAPPLTRCIFFSFLPTHPPRPPTPPTWLPLPFPSHSSISHRSQVSVTMSSRVWTQRIVGRTLRRSARRRVQARTRPPSTPNRRAIMRRRNPRRSPRHRKRTPRRRSRRRRAEVTWTGRYRPEVKKRRRQTKVSCWVRDVL